jgi:group I intron endonuclease
MVYGHIYKITNQVNNKCYYGQTRQPPNRRWSQHKQSAKKGGKMVLYAAMRKHGIENFIFEIICECATLDEMNKKEIEYISKNNTLCPTGYNAAHGGDNYEKTEETRRKISEGNKNRVVTQEWRDNISKAHIGRKNTTETIEKMKKAQKGRVIKEETKEKLRAINLGKKQSPEAIAKKSAARKGVPWSEKKRESMVGRKNTEETKQKMSLAQKGKVISDESKKKMSEAKKHKRKLTDEQVVEIKENNDKLLQCELAKKYGVSCQLISNIIHNKYKYSITPSQPLQQEEEQTP